MIRYAFKKLGMTNAFSEVGESLPVTILKLQESKIVRHEKQKNGKIIAVVEYNIGTKKKLSRGWKVENVEGLQVGENTPAPKFTVGKRVKVTGISKGCGFQDVITRYNFSGGPAAHGSRFHRAPGSVGMRTEPGRTIKGKKLPGQFGNVQVTIPNAKVAYWSEEESILAVVGGVPGASGQIVFI